MPKRTLLLTVISLGLLTCMGCDGNMMGRHDRPWRGFDSDRGRQPFDESDAGVAPQALADAAMQPGADAGAQPVVDAGQSSTQAPKDPSVDGQCPSYIGASGSPLWGCCSKFGVCGTFAANTCFLPVGTQLPLDPNATEDGGTLPVGRCIPPKIK
ncbi:MAG TPA: hypothetical protein VF331_00130 [Polyangiales bacterium]|jgi:hypothetical protein